MAMNFKPYTGARGCTVSTRPRKCAASQTIEVGHLVTLNTSGLVEKAGAATAALLGVAASAVTSSSAGDAIDVWEDPGAVYLATADATAAQAVVGDTVDVVMSGTDQLVDVGTSSTNVLEVVDLATNRDSTAADTKVLVKIAAHSIGA